jgi:AraC family transcriptional regulator
MEIRLCSGQYYGATKVHQVMQGFRLMEATYPAGLKLPRHSHQCACFSLMLQGGMTENYRSRTLESKPQTVGFNAAYEEHSNTISKSGARFLILEVDQGLTERMSKLEQFDSSVIFRGGELTWLGLRLRRETSQFDEVSSLAVEGLGLEMIATLCRLKMKYSGRVPQWLVEARDLIHAQFAEPLSVSKIADGVGVHSVHLARTFRQHYHASIGEYVRRLRIESAQRDISSTDLSLAEVALRSGFYDQGHLSRVFKRFTGLTPGAYRQSFR